jgi:hypothetical protein
MFPSLCRIPFTFFGGRIFTNWGSQKKSSAKCTEAFLEKKCKNHHNLENEFLELTRAKQESKNFEFAD